MSEVKRYIVTQTREVCVTANEAIDAAMIAAAAFENGQNSDKGVRLDESSRMSAALDDVYGNTTTFIETIETTVKLVK